MQIEQHINEYKTLINKGLDTINPKQLEEIVDIIVRACQVGANIFVAGNGGSSAISEHFTCDHMKSVYHDTKLFPRFINLTSNVSLITAIGNDIGYNSIFSEQLSYLGKENDVLIVISSSGNSPNIVKAIETANKKGIITVALTGFKGGKAKELAKYGIHIPVDNYGISEDCHQIIMHMLAQFIRKEYSPVDPNTLVL